MPLSWSVLSDLPALERLRPAWSELLRRSDDDEPTLTPAWLLSWWSVFGPLGGRKLRVVAFEDGGRLVGLAPLLLRWHWYRPGIPFRRLEPLGSGESRGDETCSEYLTIVTERGDAERITSALAKALTSGALGAWDELHMPWMNGAKPIPDLLARALQKEGARAELSATSSAPYIPLPATWDAYLKQLSTSHRYLVNRSLRDFDAWAAGTARLERAETVSDLPAALSLLASLHGDRWAASGQSGAFASPRFSAFHEAVTKELLEAGELDLLWLTAHGEPVAALYNIVHEGKVHFYQSGRRADLPPKIRPGLVIHAHAIRRAIDRGLREYDFLGGARQYKSQLSLASRTLVRLRATRSPVLEGMRAIAEAGIGKAASLRRALRERGEEPPRPPSPEAGA